VLVTDPIRPAAPVTSTRRPLNNELTP
jgi:hypothetical protein